MSKETISQKPWDHLWEELSACLNSSVSSPRFVREDPSQEAAVLLHGRIVALCAAIYRELSAGHYTSTPILLRCAIEAWVELRCISNDNRHWEFMRAEHLEQERRFWKEVSPEHTYLGEKVAEAPARLAKIAKQREETPKPMKIRDKFEKGECLDWYSSIYNDLCRHSRNSASALGLRHLHEGCVVFEKRAYPQEHVFMAQTTLALAAASLEEVSEILKVDDRSHVEQAVAIRERGRQLVGA